MRKCILGWLQKSQVWDSSMTFISSNITCYFLQHIVWHQHLDLESIWSWRWKVSLSSWQQSILSFCSVWYVFTNANKHYIVSVLILLALSRPSHSYCSVLLYIHIESARFLSSDFYHHPSATSTPHPYLPLRNTLWSNFDFHSSSCNQTWIELCNSEQVLRRAMHGLAGGGG